MVTTGAQQGEIAEVGSPVLLPADPVDTARPLGWATVAGLFATATLALANAPALSGWFDELTPTPLSERLRAPVEWWGRTTSSLTLDQPRRALRARWKAAQAARFGKERPGEQGAADTP